MTREASGRRAHAPIRRRVDERPARRPGYHWSSRRVPWRQRGPRGSDGVEQTDWERARRDQANGGMRRHRELVHHQNAIPAPDSAAASESRLLGGMSRVLPGQNPNSSAIAVRSLSASLRTEARRVWNERNSRGDTT